MHDAWDTLMEATADASTPSNAGARAHNAGPARRDLSEWTEAERIAGGAASCASRDAWLCVKRAVLARLLATARTADDLRLILLREYDAAGDSLGLAGTVLGVRDAMDAARAAAAAQSVSFDERAWMQAHLAVLSPDHLAALALGVALDDLLGYGGQSSREAAAEHVALAERYGVDVVAAARPPEQMVDAGPAGESVGQADAFADAAA